MRRGNIIKKLLLFRLIRKLPFFPLIPLGPRGAADRFVGRVAEGARPRQAPRAAHGQHRVMTTAVIA